MDDFKGTFKIDFENGFNLTEAINKSSGVSKEETEQIFKELSYSNIKLDDVESGQSKLKESELDTIFGVYGIPQEYRKEAYEKYSKRF